MLSDLEALPDYRAAFDFSGRRFVVVGAGAGMGRQTVHALAQCGADAVLCVDVAPERAAEVAAQIHVGVPYGADVTEPASVARLAEFADRELGTTHGLVNVVGQALHRN